MSTFPRPQPQPPPRIVCLQYRLRIVPPARVELLHVLA
jgi:hypothetical protein